MTVNGETAPRHYDYYGAYSDGNAWRICASREDEDLPAHAPGDHRYHKLIDGECTYGWPASHDTVAEECRAAREGVAIFDQSYFGNIHVGGSDAFAAVQWLCGADMRGRTAGDVVYTTLCNSQGGVEADLTVTTLSDGRYYFCAGGNTMTKDIEWMQRAFEHCPTQLKDVTLTDDSKDWTILSVQGPHS
jgi:glycine cleavage system aminomethyltransferase T